MRSSLQSIILFIVNIFSAYLFSLKLIDLTAMIVIIIGSIILFIIISFQSKIKKFENTLEKYSLKIKKLNEKIKIYEDISDLKIRVNLLEKEKKNDKK